MVFVGTVQSSFVLLKELLSINAEIIGVVTKKESQFNADFCDLSPLCLEYDIPCHYTTDINSQMTIDWIRNLSTDVIFCFGWSNLIKRELLNLPRLGVIGCHPAELPKNRGRHPIIWALALGLKESASTFFFMSDGADDGDILSQVKFKIKNNDNARTIYDKLLKISKKQVVKIYKDLESGTYKRIKQNDKQSNTWRKRTKDDGIIRFNMNSKTIYNLVRALTYPYVGASLMYKDKEIKIWEVKIKKSNKNNIEFGKVLKVKGNIVRVKTADGAIDIIKHEFTTLPLKGEYL